MSRVTAPVAKLSRSINSAAAGRSGLLESHHNAGAVLMPKYAELLKGGRSSEHDHSRGITTTHRPTPQPKSIQRNRPLMQTFTTSSASHSRADTSTIDFAHLPARDIDADADHFVSMRMPLLPDNFTAKHARDVADAPLAISEISIIAAHPETVSPSAMTEVEGMGIDGIELGFVHEPEPEESEPGMLKDLWKGLLDDVFGEQGKVRPAH